MKVLVINCGSSSLKYQLIDMDGQYCRLFRLDDCVCGSKGRKENILNMLNILNMQINFIL